MNRKLVLLGAGYHAREIIWLVNSINESSVPDERWELAGLIDDFTPDIKGKIVDGVMVKGGFEYFEQVDAKDLYVLAAVGEPRVKKIMVEKVKQFDLPFAVLVHPSAIIAPGVVIGSGSVVFPLSVLSVDVTLSEHVTINTACSLSHDSVIGEFATLSPRVTLAGCVKIGQGAFLGAGCTVKDHISIGEGGIIGAGAVVVDDVPAGLTAVGVPARPVRQL